MSFNLQELIEDINVMVISVPIPDVVMTPVYVPPLYVESGSKRQKLDISVAANFDGCGFGVFCSPIPLIFKFR